MSDSPSPIAQMNRLLTADGAAWRRDFSIDVEGIETTFQERRAHLEAHGGGVQPVVPNGPTRMFRGGFPIRSLIAGILTIVVLVGLFIKTSDQPKIISEPPPREIIYDPALAMGSANPQEAFAKSVTLLPCRGQSARTLTTTWLATSSEYGVVYILADCSPSFDPRPVILLLPFGKTESGQWALMGGEISPQYPAEGSHPYGISVPNWLPLPKDVYLGGLISTGDKIYSANLEDWISKQHIFITGTFDRQANRPPGAENLMIGDYPGWLVQQNNLVVITVQLPQNVSFYFASNVSVAQTIDLATRTQAHLNDLFPGFGTSS